jgi:hypothetical protein
MNNNTNESKVIFSDVKNFLKENTVAKKVGIIILAIGGIYVAGKLANGMASAIRGFRNLSSAFKGN